MSIDTNSTPGGRLRSAYSGGCISVPGVFNSLVARIADAVGFEAAYMSGAALTAGRGVPDIGLLTAGEFLDEARFITAATKVPLIADIDTGFGGPLNVERTVKSFEDAGVAAVQIEDQQSPKRCGHLSGKSLISTDEMAQKLRAASDAKKASDFVIVARTDARGVEGFNAAIDRAHAYLQAGADVIFPEALENPTEFADFARSVDAPLLANMTEFGRGPLLSLKEFDAMGYAMVLFPVTIFRVAMRAAELALREIKVKGSQVDLIESMQSRAELYELLEYGDYDARDRGFFSRPTAVGYGEDN